jgi:IPT/TIG domain.
MSPAHDIEETVQLKISLNGDFKDTLTADFIYYIQPTVLYSVPFIGSKNGNTFVQVFGKNFRDFGENLRCAFGTVYVPARFVSSNMITCR